jgi:hypothetical protein
LKAERLQGSKDEVESVRQDAGYSRFLLFGVFFGTAIANADIWSESCKQKGYSSLTTSITRLATAFQFRILETGARQGRLSATGPAE